MYVEGWWHRMFLYECPSLVYLFYLLSLPVIIFAITTKVCKYTNGSYIQTLTCYTGPCLLLSIDTLILSTYQILQVLFSSCLILFDYNDVHNLFFCSLCSPRKRSNMFFYLRLPISKQIYGSETTSVICQVSKDVACICLFLFYTGFDCQQEYFVVLKPLPRNRKGQGLFYTPFAPDLCP